MASAKRSLMMRAPQSPRVSPSPTTPASVSTSTIVLLTWVSFVLEKAAMRVTGTCTAFARTDLIFISETSPSSVSRSLSHIGAQRLGGLRVDGGRRARGVDHHAVFAPGMVRRDLFLDDVPKDVFGVALKGIAEAAAA